MLVSLYIKSYKHFKKSSMIQKMNEKLGMMVHTYNPSTKGAEAERL
jgi:hypothetical protein